MPTLLPNAAALATTPVLLPTPHAVAAYCRELALCRSERLLALGVDVRHRLCARVEVRGGPSGVAARPAQLLGPCLAAAAVGIVLVHNHPSGSPRPSAADLRYTARMRLACQIVGIALVDHVVVASGGWTSLAALGWPQAVDLTPQSAKL